MGKVKQMAMDREDDFYDIAIKVADSHTDYNQFESHMIETYRDMIFSDIEEVLENLRMIFGERSEVIGHA